MTLQLLDGARRSLLDAFKRSGALSLDEATEIIGLAKTTVRQHLLQMEQSNLITRSYSGAGRGRPRVVFELSETGKAMYPTQEPVLLRELLAFLTENGNGEIVEEFLEGYWERQKIRFVEILNSLGGKPDSRKRNQALRRVLEEGGFMPQEDSKGEKGARKRFIVREHNCPFPQTVKVTRLPCRLESKFIQWALRHPIERKEYLLNSDTACTYVERRK